ncbi:hypothetical protein V1477_012764 [Vespula maculifrons]|uniref:Uncharacterized protein n=1 Tax=Vespula maculifrons TaxID=7453 RepID=A0ABD2BUJ7_VESMC
MAPLFKVHAYPKREWEILRSHVKLWNKMKEEEKEEEEEEEETRQKRIEKPSPAAALHSYLASSITYFIFPQNCPIFLTTMPTSPHTPPPPPTPLLPPPSTLLL